MGGDSSPRAIIEEALNYGVPIYKTYGMTETCSGISGFWVSKNKDIIAFVPPFARYSYEVWIMPRKKIAGPWLFNNRQKISLGACLK